MSAPGTYPEPPTDYVTNERGTWAICKLCGTGLLGFKHRTDTQRNAIEHLFNNHPRWQESE